METKTIELALYHDIECDIISTRNVKDEKYILMQSGFVRISDAVKVCFHLIPDLDYKEQQVHNLDIKLKELGAQVSSLMDEREVLVNERDQEVTS